MDRNEHRMHLQNSLFFALVLLFQANFVGAQVTAGVSPTSAIESHAIDSINLQNLNIMLNFPVMSKSGVMPFSFAFSENSYLFQNNSTWGVTAPLMQGTINGWLGAGAPIVVKAATITSTFCHNGTGTDTLTNWSVKLADSSWHELPGADVIDSAGCISSSFTDTTADGTGLTVQVTNIGTSGTVTFPNGIGVSVTGALGYLTSSFATDSNGNKVSTNTNGTSFTDSLGLTALTASYATGGNVFSWTDVNGGSPQVTTTNTNTSLTSSFNCSGITELSGSQNLPTNVSYADGRSLGISYTAQGRIHVLTLPGGGSVTYTYSGGNSGINCTYQVTPVLTRATSDGTTTYTWAAVNNGSGQWGNTTTVVDNGGNKTVYTFTGLTATGNANYPAIQALTQVQHYQGSSTLLTTDVYCYSAASGQPGNCSTAVVSLPISEVDVYHTINGMSTSSRVQTKYDIYGNVTYSSQYDFGASSPTIATTTTFGTWNGSSCAAIGNSINNKPCDVLKQAVSTTGNPTIAESRYTYDTRGNLLTTYLWTGTTWLSNTTPNSYNANGTIATAYDLANNATTYSYSSANYVSCGACTNYPFPTSISAGGLTSSSIWHGTGGVKISDTDANGKTTTYCYNTGANCAGGVADPLWRVLQTIDPLSNVVTTAYPSATSPTSVSQNLAFNAGNSILNTIAATDAYGRKTAGQIQQGPSSSNYDTISMVYGWSSNYRTVATSEPCTQSVSGSCATAHTSFIDPLGRLHQATTTSNETITHTYTQNDDLVVLGPAPTGENVKQVQKEFDGLGRPTKVCKIGNGSSTACGQNTGTQNGVTTSHSYTYASGSSTTSATRGSQTRTTVYDAMGRATSVTTPEGGTVTYTYDTLPSACSSAAVAKPGKLIMSAYANSNYSCYQYDALGRTIAITASSSTTATCRRFYYDNSRGALGTIPTGITINNANGRMVEAETDNCTWPVTSSTMITDEWFSYDSNGHTTDLWEMTPHSGQYYHSIATFAANGVVTSLQLASPSLYTMNYGLDGEGRWDTLSKGSTQIVTCPGSPCTTMYDAAGRVLNVQLTGNTPDQDIYTYDQNTGRMKTFEFEVGNTPKNLTGTLHWNANGTLGELQIVDGFNSGGSETCYSDSSSALGYGYDDWGRLAEFDCGTGNWGQQFSYDQYDNLTQTVISGRTGSTWNPGYNTNNNQVTGATYDSSGNMTNDGGSNVYGWNEFNQIKWTATSGTPTCGTNGKCVTYDALGRMVETSSGSTWTELWYTQVPGSRISMKGATESYAYWPSPGRGTYVDSPPSNSIFLHQDWLGNDRVASAIGSHSVTADRAYAPYGEQYNTFGSSNPTYGIFAGISGDFDSGVLFDTPNRELAQSQGRWISPDPAGAGWNSYGYSTNPNSDIDPSGLMSIWNTTSAFKATPMDALPVCTDDCVIGGYDIFDAIMGEPGTYLTVNIYGQIGFGFSEDLWVQAENFLTESNANLQSVSASLAAGSGDKLQWDPNPPLTVFVEDFGIYAITSGLLSEYLKKESDQQWILSLLTPKESTFFLAGQVAPSVVIPGKRNAYLVGLLQVYGNEVTDYSSDFNASFAVSEIPIQP